MQNKTQDYNAYKHDDMDLNNIFLCLPPFVKIDQTKNWGGGIQKEIKLYQMMIEYIYIYKFMLQNENTESIKALQETFIKEHLSIIGFYLIL